MKNVLVVSPDPVFYGPLLSAFVGTDYHAVPVNSVEMATARMRDNTRGKIQAVVTAGRSNDVEFADLIVPIAKELGIRLIIVLTKYKYEYEMQHEADPEVHVVSNCNQNYGMEVLRILDRARASLRSQVLQRPQSLELTE